MTKKTNIKTPNIFDYATSELSQDAFFAWLLEWAEDKYAQVDNELHKCAVDLLTTFFDDYYEKYKDDPEVGGIKKFKYDQKTTKIESIEIEKQKKRIDLLLTIKTNTQIYYLVIEDKKNFKPHDKQLEKYRSYFNDKEKKRTCFIYLKTGELEPKEKTIVNSAKYFIFDLNSVYDVLNNYNPDNLIFKDYYSKLEAAYYLRKFHNEVNFDDLFKDSCYKHGTWKDNCYWFYKKGRLKCEELEKYYLALDVWLDRHNLDFSFHIISDLNGTWITDFRMADIEKIKEICLEDKDYTYDTGGNYYKRTVPVKNLDADLNDLIKNEIKKQFPANKCLSKDR